jgi:hypothetical protein
MKTKLFKTRPSQVRKEDNRCLDKLDMTSPDKLDMTAPGKLGMTFALALLLAMPQGCELEVVNYSRFNETLFPKSEGHAKALLADMYSDFGGHWRSIVTTQGHYIAECVTDEAMYVWYNEYNYNYYEASSYWFGYDNEDKKMWNFLPKISSAILNMERIRGIEGMDEELKKSYMAELHCGLGWLGFILYDYFGTIPLPTLDILQNPLLGGGILLERATDEEMQAFIESHLIEAAQSLPYGHLAPGEPRYTSADYGRFTKGVAYMVLLKFYMMIGDWDKAEATGRELMKPEHGYALMSNYNDIFTLDYEVNSESIYAGILDEGVSEWTQFAPMLPADYDDGKDLTKWGMYKMTWPFYDTYDPDDARLQRILTEYTSTNGVFHNREIDRAKGTGGELYWGPIPLKYSYDKGVDGIISSIDVHIFRYADALTLLAEAIVRNADAVTPEAFNLLNAVRARAFPNNPGKHYQLSQLNNMQDFLDELLAERGRELYFEGCRRQDLLRHGQFGSSDKFIEAAIAKNKFYGAPTSHLENPEGALKYKKFPLPPSVIIMNQGLIKQNPGY